MLSETLQDALNDQMRYEYYSAYLYMAVAGHFENEDLQGFSNFFRVQAAEELTHADKFFHFICDAGGRTHMLPIDEPRNEYASPLDAFEHSLEHEQFVTSRIASLSDLAIAEGDHAARIFLEWFVTEQVEEEASFSTIVKKLKLVGSDGNGLLRLDQELGQRVFTPPAAGQA